MNRVQFMGFSALVLLVLGTTASAQDDTRIKLKVGRETTYFDGPVNEDGTIDYVAALNKAFGEGIANDTNAYALLALMHPALTEQTSEDHRLYRNRLFELMGLLSDDALPSLVLWEEFSSQAGLKANESDEMFSQAMSGPWSQEQLPHIDAWLRTNEKLLEQMDLALDRPNYFAPCVRIIDNEPLSSVLLPQLVLLRHAGKLLVIHANRAMNDGDLQAFVEDLNRLHRMGKHLSHEQTSLGALVGISMNSLKTPLVETLCARGALSHDLAMRFLKTYHVVGEHDTMRRVNDLTERCQVLDVIQRAHVGEKTGLDFLLSDGDETEEQLAVKKVIHTRIEELARSRFFDINRSLRTINGYFDQISEIMMIGDVRERRDALAALDEQFNRHGQFRSLFDLVGIATLETLPEDWTVERFTDEVTATYAHLLMQALNAADRTQTRCNARLRVEATAIALLGYRAQHGRLPETIDELVPLYFDKVPLDFATGKPLVYRINADGSAVVYSIGDNFIDDGGVDDYKTGDIATRIGAMNR